MSILYVESSAVLAWLLGEPAQDVVIDVLSGAEQVVTSALTGVECSRGLLRARLDRRISDVEERAALRLLDEALASWHVIDLAGDVLTTACHELPCEPVRTLDALHLASAQVLHRAARTLEVLSLDDRVRRSSEALGMTIHPA